MCTQDDHVVGSIANLPVRQSEWPEAIDAFARKIDDFNIRGQRVQIPHPGHVLSCKFCPECGTPIDFTKMRSFGEALSAVETERAKDGKNKIMKRQGKR